MMIRSRRRLNVECWLPVGTPADEWIVRAISGLPPAYAPEFFGGSERLDRRRARPVSDTEALRARTRQHSSASLQGEKVSLNAISWDGRLGCVHARFDSQAASAAAIRSWMLALDCAGLIYARA